MTHTGDLRSNERRSRFPLTDPCGVEPHRCRTRKKSGANRAATFVDVPGDRPVAGVPPPPRTTGFGQLQGLTVAAAACLPLTVSGHYTASAIADRPQTDLAPLLWLVTFAVLGVTLLFAALSGLLPGWHRAGRRYAVLLSFGSVIATFDHWRLVGAPTGLALNVVGLGMVVAALQAMYWTRRSPMTTIAPRPSERLHEWAAGILALGGFLAFALPHPSTIDGVPEDCSPLWIVVERDCVSADVLWWPIAVAASALGTVILSVIHHDPTVGGISRRGPKATTHVRPPASTPKHRLHKATRARK